jgi:hypothetical protein
MFLYRMIVFILFAVVFTSGPAFCQEENNDQDVQIITGTIISIDQEGSSMYVKTSSADMLFYISAESNLYQNTHHITSLEIKAGDPVKIKYKAVLGKNKIIKLLDSRPPDF